MRLPVFKKKDEWKGKRRGRVVSITLSEELLTEIDEIAKRYGVTRSQLIRDAIIEKIERLSKPGS